MSDRELWLLSLAVATVVVVVVALLLGLIVAVLKNIDRNAADVSTAGKRIAENTVALWTLEQTDRDLARLTEAARPSGFLGRTVARATLSSSAADGLPHAVHCARRTSAA